MIYRPAVHGSKPWLFMTQFINNADIGKNTRIIQNRIFNRSEAAILLPQLS
ncbi:MAG TPA: hypothetical protein VI959_03055 [Alphaproteobacteria bacterium]|nr:hypothetical protein [Alphaproteobacteria bacterium]